MSVIGIDIDGTLAASAAWVSGTAIGEPSAEAVEMIKALHREGHHLYAWSCRADYVIRQYLRDNGLEIYFMGVNSSSLPSDSQKISLDFYIGDDAVRWTADRKDEILTLIKREGSVPTKVIARDHNFSDQAPKPYYAGVGEMYVDMFEEHWRKAWRDKAEEEGWTKPYAFLTICSHAKPYSKSFIHTSIRRELHGAGLLEDYDYDYVHISNAGIVPAYAEMRHPFNAYDWNGQGSPLAIQHHIDTIERRFKGWLDNIAPAYQHTVIYLRDKGNTCGAVERVLEREGQHPKVTLVKAESLSYHYPEFVRVKDPDDCLTHHDNLRKLINAFDKVRG